MKKLLISTFIFLSLFSVAWAENQNKPILYIGNGCHYCARVEKFIEENNLNKNIIEKEIYQNSENANEFNALCDKEGLGLMDRGVPFLYTDEECIMGDKPIINYLKSNAVLKNQALGDTEKDKVLNNEKKSSSQKLTLPVLIGASLADSINPCSFAVLIILMTTILASGRKKRALYSGLAFSLSIFISYLLTGLGLYSVIASFATSRIFMQVVGVLAILLGLFNLKDFFWYGKGFLMEVPLDWRPKLKSLLHSITNPIGAFLIGFLVSLFLLPCTSGPYLVIIGMLGNENTYAKAIWLLVLYNLIFILPMLGITLGAYFGLDLQKAEKARTKKAKYIHLITGIIMLGIGILLLFRVI